LSRFNEMSGGCEKRVPVSGSFWSNLKFLRIMDLSQKPKINNNIITKSANIALYSASLG